MPIILLFDFEQVAHLKSDTVDLLFLYFKEFVYLLWGIKNMLEKYFGLYNDAFILFLLSL